MTEDPLSIEHRILIDAPRRKVWRVLTEPQYVSEWLGCMRYEKAVDHIFYMQQDPEKRSGDDIEGATHCRIIALDEPALFAFSWYLPDTPETEVRIQLEDKGASTEATLTHTGWNQFDAEMIRQIRDGLDGGWKSAVLPNLKRVAES